MKHSSETLESEVEAYREHQPRLVEAVAKARDMVRETKRENARLTDQTKNRRQQVVAALQSRDWYRQFVSTLEEAHYADGGSCACGNRECDVFEALKVLRRQDRTYWR